MIPVSRPSLGALERELLTDAFDSGWISSRGSYVEEAESLLAETLGVHHAVTVSSGTSALHLALLASGIGVGDEVIVPSFTYVATVAAVRYCGADPVFVDVDTSDWCIAVPEIEAALSEKTAAVLSVDIYGHPAPAKCLQGLLHGLNVLQVSDSAECFLGTDNGCGPDAYADAAIYSFFGNKVITCGEGGCVTTNSADLATSIRTLKNQGNSPNRQYWHDVVGYNYRLTNLSAAILVAQLRRSEDLIARRNEVIERYESNLTNVDGIELQPVRSGVRRSPWMMSLLVQEGSARTRDEVAQFLLERGVESRPFFQPIHSMPPYQHHRAVGHLPNTSRLAERGLNLPTFPGLSDGEVDLISDLVVRSVRGRS